MATRYVDTKTAPLFAEASGRKQNAVLIFGDEVEVSGRAKNGRIAATSRDLTGWIDQDKLRDEPVLELYFVDVGQGDATFIVTPRRKTILVDGGINRRARGFLAWKYRLDKFRNTAPIDLMVLTHADDDHLCGLTEIVKDEAFDVRRIVHSGLAKYEKGLGKGKKTAKGSCLLTRHDSVADLGDQKLADKFDAWIDAVKDRGVDYSAVDTESEIDVGDPAISIEVLGPRLVEGPGKAPFLCYFDNEDSKAINGNSVVLRLQYKGVSVLLAGDLNATSEEFLLEDASVRDRFGAHVLKVPHHGSHDWSPSFLKHVRPQVSVVSSGDSPDHGHPRASFIGAIGRYSRSDHPLLFSTEIAAAFVETHGVATEPPSSEARAAHAEDRQLFKRRLHGMINVRTDGERIFAARRVAAGYWWESYGPMSPAP